MRRLAWLALAAMVSVPAVGTVHPPNDDATQVPPAEAADAVASMRASKERTCTIRGRVAVLPRKPAAAVKDYGPPPAFVVEPPDPPASAVWVGSGAPAVDTASTPPVRIEQRGFQFRPALSVVQTGTPVVFPNEDQLYHSVFSYSQAKRFDLGRYRKGEEPAAIVFDRAGLVQLFCEVHEHMRANLVVVDTPWHAVTGADGSFRIEGVAPGRHTVSVWLSPRRTETFTVELEPGQDLEVDWTASGESDSK